MKRGVVTSRRPRDGVRRRPGASCNVSDERAAKTDQVVAVDDQGQPVAESQDMTPEPQRDAGGFEKVLDESLDDLHPGRDE